MDDTSGLQRLVNGSSGFIPNIPSNAIADGNFAKTSKQSRDAPGVLPWIFVASDVHWATHVFIDEGVLAGSGVIDQCEFLVRLAAPIGRFGTPPPGNLCSGPWWSRNFRPEFGAWTSWTY